MPNHIKHSRETRKRIVELWNEERVYFKPMSKGKNSLSAISKLTGVPIETARKIINAKLWGNALSIKQKDWPKILRELRRDYKNLWQVAIEVGAKGDSLTKIERGEVVQPKWLAGQKLIELHGVHSK